MRYQVFVLYCHIMHWPPSFWAPSPSFLKEFLFLPSDEQYCGPTGPTDKCYDPRHDPVADDSIMECRLFLRDVPQTRTANAEPPAGAPAAKVVDDTWFPKPHCTPEFYNSLVEVARSAVVDEFKEASRVDAGLLTTGNYVFRE